MKLRELREARRRVAPEEDAEEDWGEFWQQRYVPKQFAQEFMGEPFTTATTSEAYVHGRLIVVDNGDERRTTTLEELNEREYCYGNAARHGMIRQGRGPEENIGDFARRSGATRESVQRCYDQLMDAEFERRKQRKSSEQIFGIDPGSGDSTSVGVFARRR